MITETYLELWLETFVRPFRAPSTAACYRRAISALPPDLLAADLAELDGLRLQAAINQQAVKHPRAAQLTFAALHVALAKAVQLEYIHRNPMAACIKPVHQAKIASVLSAAQLAAYIAAARAEAVFPLLLLIGTLGLRRSEALGLTWSAVDLAGGCVLISQQRMRIDHRMQVRPLKSRASCRVLPIPAPLAAELGRIRAEQRVVSMAGFVVDTNPDTLRKAHVRTLQRAGLPPVTLHGLRHSVATLAAASGCPMKILQGILGHSKYELTANLYADHITYDVLAPQLSMVASAVLG